MRDGVLVCEADLNLIEQVMDSWVFRMTSRFPMYADLLKRYTDEEVEFAPQIIKDPAMA